MITMVNSSAALTAALGKAHAGDTIVLKAGNYGVVKIADTNFSGAGVTIVSDKAASPARMSELHVNSSSGLHFKDIELVVDDPRYGYAGNVFRSQHITFDGLNVHGSLDGDPGNDERGLMVRESQNVTISNSEFHELNWGVAHLNSKGFTVKDSSFHDIRIDGIRGGGSSKVTITDNSFRDFHSKQGDHPDFIQFWTHGTTTPGRDILITGNMMVRGDGYYPQGIFMRDELGHLPYENVVIRGNLVSGGMYNGIAIYHGKNVVIDDNVVQGHVGMLSRIHLVDVKGATVTNNETTRMLFNNATAVTEKGTVILPLAADKGAAVIADWLSDRGGQHGGGGHHGGGGEHAGGGDKAGGGDHAGGDHAGGDHAGGGDHSGGAEPTAGRSLIGTAGVDTLTGGAGADTLSGGAGADRLVGGGGDDVYVIAGKPTIVEHAGGGIDTVKTTGWFTLPNHVENGEVAASTKVTTAVNGNGLDNVLRGNAVGNMLGGAGGNDTINGAGGNDTISGGYGNDRLTGGAGADKFVFGKGSGQDVITDFGSGGHDVIDASGLLSAGYKATLTETASGVKIAFTSGDSIFLQGADLSDLHATSTGWIF